MQPKPERRPLRAESLAVPEPQVRALALDMDVARSSGAPAQIRAELTQVRETPLPWRPSPPSARAVTLHHAPVESTPCRPMASWTEDLPLAALAEEFGTPLYLHHPPTLERAFAAYAALVGPAGVRYPVKANPSPLVLEAVARRGGGADCASRSETLTALSAGIPPERISYNTPAPSIEHAVQLLRQGATVVADSPHMLRALADRVEPSGLRGRLFVRVNPGRLPGYLAAGGHQRYTAHGDPRSQFGIPSEELIDAIRGLRLPITGLHVHVGTMMDNLEAFAQGLEFLHALADEVRDATDHRPTTINLGGGLGLPHDRTQQHPTIEALAGALAGRLREDLDYQVEPGNSLVGDSFALLTRIVAMKDTRGRRFGVCDVGTDQLIKHTVAGWRHEIVDATHRPLPQEGEDALAGPLCFAGDVLLPSTDLSGLGQGDLLLVRHTGAYCEAIASRFNGRLGPPTVVVEEGRPARLARSAEDPFLASESTARRPIPSPSDGTPVEEVPAGRIAALQSGYMHREAQQDRYEIESVRRTAPATYEFTVVVDAPCGFVGMPLAVRIVGDASIAAIGLELGWTEKRGAVLARKLVMSCDAMLPGSGTLPCRVVVSALGPSGSNGDRLAGAVRFELGEGPAVHGTAQVCAPVA